jgi:hypothetical protein
VAVHGVADMAFEGSDGFLVGFALLDPPFEVGPAVGVGLAELADGGHVHGVVEVSVAALGEAVHGPPAGGELDRGGAVVGGVAVGVGEPGLPPADRTPVSMLLAGCV